MNISKRMLAWLAVLTMTAAGGAGALAVETNGQQTTQGEIGMQTNQSTDHTGLAGDINADGTVNTTDARLALQHAVGKITLTEAEQEAADVNGDGGVDTTDARLILQAAVGKITLPDKEVAAMADMPGLAISPDFSGRARRAAGGPDWTDLQDFAYKSDHVNHMARLKASRRVELQVTNRYGDISVYRLEPQRYEITPTVEGDTLTFTAEPLQKFAIQFEDTHTWLILAVEPFENDVPQPEDDNVVNILDFVDDNTGETDVYEGIDAAIDYMLETPGKDTLYFPDGIYRTHSIELSLVENLSFYFCEGTRIVWDDDCWGSNVFRLSGCNNIRFYGRGIIDATYRIHKGRGSSGIGWWDGINLTHLSGRISNGLRIDGLWFFDTPNSPMRTEGGNNATFYNTKYVNYGGYQNDNLVVYGGSHVVFEEGIGTGDDDSWSAHTGAWGGFTDTRDVTIRNSTYIADGIEGRGGIAYGCNESNPEGGATWNVLYENLSLIDFGQALDSYNIPVGGLYGNFVFRNVHFETPSATGEAFDHFQNLSGVIVLDGCTFATKGGAIEGNPANPIETLYINNLTMAGERITSAEQGEFEIKNAESVVWDGELPAAFIPSEPVPVPAPVPVSSLPIADDFEDGTMMGWTDLSGSKNGTCETVSKDGSLLLSDTESSGVTGVMKAFAPQRQDRVVTIEMDVKPAAADRISNIYINDRVGAVVAGVRFYNNGKIKYFGTKGSNFEVGEDLMSYRAQKWYHLKWVIDVGMGRYDLYIGEGQGVVGEKTLGNVSFKCPLPNIASVRMDTESIWLAYAGQKASFQVDNVSVQSEESDGTLFDPDDTEIQIGGKVEKTNIFNDNADSVVYTGSWSAAGNRVYGDYNSDVHHTQTDGDSVSFTFEGVGVEYITELNSDEGLVDVYLDGEFRETVDCHAASRSAQQTAFRAEGLEPGRHTLRLVKKSGEYMLVDAFIVLLP